MLAVPRGLPRKGALLVFSLGLGACLFPEYTFNESSGGAGGKGTTNSTASSTSVVSSSASGTGGTGGMPPTEDCFNGMDDDGDMLADCEDPDCDADTDCVDPIPVGWGKYGYVVLGEAGVAPACPSYATQSKYTGNKDLANTGFSCSNCSCGTPMNRSCELKTDLDPGTSGLQLFQVFNQPCGTAATNIVTLTDPNPWNLACDNTNQAPGGQTCVGGTACNASISTQAPTVTGGNCAPGGGVINKTSPTWQVAANACGGIPALSGCTNGQKCMPKSSSPYFSGVCIGKDGDQTCPAPFNTKHLYYKSFVDDRMCTACTCQAPTGGTCGIALTISTDGACASDIVTFNAGTCQDLTGNPTIAGRAGVVNDPPHGGGCSPTSVTSAKLGDVVPTTSSSTTFCCL